MLTFEVAAPPGDCTGMTLPSLGSDAPCTVLRVSRRLPSGDLEPVPLFRADADHTQDSAGSYELRFNGLDVSFDARLAAGEAHDLEIAVYTGDPWTPSYGAHLENVRLDQASVRVRLYPFRQWACPGWRVMGTLAPRALHEAVALSNGDVLLLGGVTGDAIDPASAGRDDPSHPGAILQPIVEAYDSDEHRFYPVTMQDGAVFARVLFGAIYVGEESPGQHRIRVIGGLTLPDDRLGTPVLGFDNSGVLTTLGAPYHPSAAAEPAQPVDLIYDSEQHTLRVTAPAVVPTGTTEAAAIVVSSPRSDGSRAILLGLAPRGSEWEPPTEYYPTSPTGARSLAHQRLGATVDAMPILDRFLVWGGDLSTTPAVLENAGELLQPTDPASATPISAVGGLLPPPAAFHSTTRIGEDVLVVAGGLTIDLGGTLGSVAPTGDDALFALQVGSAGTVTRLPVVVPAGMSYVPTILHTATYVPGFGVVLVGGARVAAGDRLQPTATAARVMGGVGTFELDDALQDVTTARFGHAATLLPGKRLLVTGGLTREGASTALRAIAAPELIYLGREPYPSIRDVECVDQAALPDGGVDAGPPPDGGPVPDGGTVPDAAPPPDAG